MSLSLDHAQLVALALEGVLFGFNLVTLFACLKALLWRDERFYPLHSIRWTMLIVCLLFAAIAFIDFAILFYQVIQAFTMSPDGSLTESSGVPEWTNFLKVIQLLPASWVTSQVQVADGFPPALIGDLVLVYRCWIVYSKSKAIVILPFLLWIGSVVCGMIAIAHQTMTHASISLTTVSEMRPFMIAFLAFTLAQNIVTTSLIVCRIWIIDRAVLWKRGSQYRSPLRRVMRAIIESCMLYSVCLVVSFGFFLARSNVVYIMTSLTCQVVGIAFNLLIIRTHDKSLALPSSSTFHLTTLDPSSLAISEDIEVEAV